jgi:hypothetical protein
MRQSVVVASRWFKRQWGESRGDAYDSWGTATYFFEIDEQAYPVRQMEVYEGGQRLKYSADHPKDDFGMLADDVPLDLADFAQFEIASSEFDTAWSIGPATNESS